MPVMDKELPVSNKETVEIPKENKRRKKVPEAKELDKEMPTPDHPENCVTLKGKTIEIKPTKLKYFRNRTASVYKLLKMIPLTEFLAYDKGTFDPERDADQMLFDFLTAVFDDARLVTESYDDMSAEDIERVLEIFGRLNHIDEKDEAARKNREAQANR